ncbi:MAG: hypothetical protein KGL39_02700 [Patescibacteria group bacterium]|nr:hypothetical protein [Patescibacteria group bacterium]
MNVRIFNQKYPTECKVVQINPCSFGWFIIYTIGTIILCVVVVSFIINLIGLQATDSTDASKWKRSELEVHVDHATGVNYVESWTGAMCVRVNTNGTPYVTKP